MAIITIEEVDELASALQEPTGFNRADESTLGIIEMSPDGINILRINSNGTFSFNSSGKFGLGTAFEKPAGVRTLVIYPSSSSFSFWILGRKFEYTQMKELPLSNFTGERLIYFDDSGSLQEAITSTDIQNVFKYYVAISAIYGNSTTQQKLTFADERHGRRMDGDTHSYLHLTRGTQYFSGATISGLSASGTTYSSISSGIFYDEDIKHSPVSMINSPFWYQTITGWEIAPDTNLLAYKLLSVAQYNLFSTNWILSPIDNGKYALVHIFFTGDSQFPYVKILGQTQYATKALAKVGATIEINKLQLDGLPSLEFKALYSIIINYQGQLELTDDGLTSIDFRKVVTR